MRNLTRATIVSNTLKKYSVLHWFWFYSGFQVPCFPYAQISKTFYQYFFLHLWTRHLLAAFLGHLAPLSGVPLFRLDCPFLGQKMPLTQGGLITCLIQSHQNVDLAQRILKDDQSVKYKTRNQMKCCWRSINNVSHLGLKFK